LIDPTLQQSQSAEVHRVSKSGILRRLDISRNGISLSSEDTLEYK
jgi:hypothetical protein